MTATKTSWTAGALATAWLAGPWTIEGMRERTRTALRRDQLPKAVDEMVGGFWRLLRDRPAGRSLRALAAAIDAHPAMEKLGPRPRIGAVLDRPVMEPAPGADFGVPDLPTLDALATWLDLDVGELHWLADGRCTAEHYLRSWRGRRLIEAPRPRLKRVQRDIGRGLLARIPTHDAAHGFCAGRSVLTAVRPHAARPMLLVMDLRCYFPSIAAAQVRALLRTVGYPEAVANTLTWLCTTRPSALPPAAADGECASPADAQRYRSRHLPQGAPTSPALANLCSFGLDRRLRAYAARAGARYTRYADDLLFSGPACIRAPGFRAGLRRILRAEGFAENPRKTRAMPQSARQTALGLVLNDRPRLARSEREALEAIVTNCARHGLESQNRDGVPDFASVLAGRVAWARQVEPDWGARLQRRLDSVCG